MNIEVIKPNNVFWTRDGKCALYYKDHTPAGTSTHIEVNGIRQWHCSEVATSDERLFWSRSFRAVIDDFGQLVEVKQ